MLTGDLPVSQHHRALAEAIGVVYHWDLVTDELTIPVVSVYKREQTNNGVARTVPVSLPRLSFLNPPAKAKIVSSDPTAVEVEAREPLVKVAGPVLCPRGKPASRWSGQPLDPLEAQIYGLRMDRYGSRAIGQMLGLHESSVRRAYFKARAKMGEFDDPACPKD